MLIYLLKDLPDDSSTLVFDLLSEAKKTPDDKIKEAIEKVISWIKNAFKAWN